jgi:hypothetical protein
MQPLDTCASLHGMLIDQGLADTNKATALSVHVHGPSRHTPPPNYVCEACRPQQRTGRIMSARSSVR